MHDYNIDARIDESLKIPEIRNRYYMTVNKNTNMCECRCMDDKVA